MQPGVHSSRNDARFFYAEKYWLSERPPAETAPLNMPECKIKIDFEATPTAIIFALQLKSWRFVFKGELAQLVERLHGMQEVTGSNPVFSTSVITRV